MYKTVHGTHWYSYSIKYQEFAGKIKIFAPNKIT